jgi:hypothetical protein
MQHRPFIALGRALASASILAILALAPVGCGGGESKPATKTGMPPEIEQANKNMEDFAKSQQKKK